MNKFGSCCCEIEKKGEGGKEKGAIPLYIYNLSNANMRKRDIRKKREREEF